MNPNAAGGVSKPRSMADLAKAGPSAALRKAKIGARNEEKTAGRMAARAAAAASVTPAPVEPPATPAPPAPPTTPDAASKGNQPWWWNPNRAGSPMGSAGPTSFGGAGTAGSAQGGQQGSSTDAFWNWLRENGYVR